jgi:hypothetical protein
MKKAIVARGRSAALAIGGAMLATTAYAESAVIGHLTRIGTGVGGEGLYLTLDQPTSPACSSGMLFMPTSAAQYKETYATALAAFFQGIPITVYYSPTCNGANIWFDAVSISPQ